METIEEEKINERNIQDVYQITNYDPIPVIGRNWPEEAGGSPNNADRQRYNHRRYEKLLLFRQQLSQALWQGSPDLLN